MAQGHKVCEIDWLWVRCPLEEKKYLFTFKFSFLRSGVEAKRGVKFRHSPSSELDGSGERSVLTLGSLCLPCCVRLHIHREADLLFNLINIFLSQVE